MPLTLPEIQFRCRRGMLELDLILGRFLKQYWSALKEDEHLAFEQLLESPDPDLYAWFMGYDEPQNEQFKQIVALIQQYGRP